MLNQQHKFDNIYSSINNKEDLSESLRAFEMVFRSGLRISQPQVFDETVVNEDSKWLAACDFVLSRYNRCIDNNEDIRSAFQREREIFKAKNSKYYAILDEIGNALYKGDINSLYEVGK